MDEDGCSDLHDLQQLLIRLMLDICPSTKAKLPRHKTGISYSS